MRRRSLRLSDRGASLFLTAIALFVLMGAAAIAVDLAALRADRSADQKVSDSAAAAGVIAALEATPSTAGLEACKAALAYAEVNVERSVSFDDSGCAASFLGPSCDPLLAESHTVISDRFTVTVVYPVPDAHALMDSGVFGTPQAVVPEDGDPCERVGVEISAGRQGFFSQVIGFDQGTTTVHTVATATLAGGDGVPVNLLVLDRTGCEVIDVQGNGGIVVGAVVNEAGDGLIPGVAAADSDGSAGCLPDGGVIDVDGGPPVLRADGPAGCGSQTATSTTVVGSQTLTVGLGCGLVQTLAPGATGVGCNFPACTNGSNPHPIPDPTALPGRLTRAPIDHRYNCWTDYTSPPPLVGWATDSLTVANEQDIPGCTEGTPPHIYDLIEFVGQSGTPVGYQTWSGLGLPCDIPSSSLPITVSGNVRVDCSTLTVRTTVMLGDPVSGDSNVIFDGNVEVTGNSGDLQILNVAGSPGWAFFRGGTLLKRGQGSLTIDHTAVYMSRSSALDIRGAPDPNDGVLSWIAPNSGDFDDLALWSDSPATHFWAGQGKLQMEGVFFMPWATADYSGGSGQNQTEAQWVADRLVARGKGQLEIVPSFGRAVTFDLNPRTTLVR